MFPNFALLLLINSGGEILLLRRINTPFCNGCYSLPGGQIDRGETARQTMVREAKNNLDLDIQLSDMMFRHIMYRKCNEPEFFACFFQIDQWDDAICNANSDRYDDVRWFSINRLPENIVLAHKEAIMFIQQGIMYSEHGW